MSEPIRVVVSGVERRVDTGTTAGQVLEAGPGVVAARVGGELRDLDHRLLDGASVEAVRADEPDGRSVLRHSAAHVLAQAVQELFPDAKLGIGPPIENGFYYDFDVARPFTPEDLDRIETRMRQIVKERQRFSRRPVTEGEARAELADEPYKLELIGLKGAPSEEDGSAVEVGGGELTIYDNLRPDGTTAWKDLCRGPHVPTTRDIPAFRLTRVAAAYWRGSEDNPQLQRIYGTAWESKEAMRAHLDMLAEAEKRDHRRLGAELDLFSFPEEIGSGLAVWHPRGGIVRRVMEEYSRRRHEAAGYEFVYTPHLSKEALFQTSGHLQWYADAMYPAMELDQGHRYYLKPMNCPMHMMIFRSRGRSYRELPLRLFEFGTVYRYEKSGVVHGLTRARGFTQDDSHIFCTPEQLADELASLLDFVVGLLRDYGLTEFTAELSTRPEKFVGEVEDWDAAEAALEAAIERAGLPYEVAEGEGAFYAPKIDVHVRDAIGRRWQLSTLQVDLQFPDRFDLEYQAADGTRRRPSVIHRALFGSEERFFGILLEHYAGAFPAWLAPVQVVGIPIGDAHVPHLEEVASRLREHGIRVEVDTSPDRMQKKIRTAQKQKVPFMLIAGDDDVARSAVSFRYRDGTQKNAVPVEEAVAEVVYAVERRLPT
ncbi:MAG TPA: threonine--tRNA ligase [Jiangellales bacterium]|nr:threonine--tRNA ligase [Jiangellales bacterium]